jgi:hypothetical protein
MRKLINAAALLAAALCVSAATPAGAAMFATSSGLTPAASVLDVTENVQYVYGGRRHCWYPDGWHGPGWYWCGYQMRRGYGWGGPAGWRGWSYGGGPVVVAPRRGPVIVGPRRGPGFVGPRRGPPPRRGPVVIVR